jgi:hypothetical protein
MRYASLLPKSQKGLKMRHQRNCKVLLSEHDLAEKAKQLSSLQIQKTDKGDEKKEFVKAINAEIEAMDAEITVLARIVNQGFEERLLEVTERYDKENDIVEFFSVETGEKVDWRAATNKDRQGSFDFEPEDDSVIDSTLDDEGAHIEDDYSAVGNLNLLESGE